MSLLYNYYYNTESESQEVEDISIKTDSSDGVQKVVAHIQNGRVSKDKDTTYTENNDLDVMTKCAISHDLPGIYIFSEVLG